MKAFLTLVFLCCTASAVKHSLKYFLTATSGATNFPEFVGIATLDEVQIGYCDNLEGEAQLKQNWMKKLMSKTPKHLKMYTEKCSRNHLVFKANMDDFKQRLNQTEGFHVLQRMNGCEWDDESNETEGFNQYGYDGEDLMVLDLKTLTWNTPKAQFVVIKHLWDANKERLELNKNYYMYDCPKLVQEYVHFGSSFLQRTEHPSVSLLQKTPSSLVSCHATGFYPDRADLFWRKDREEIHEGVEKGQILPNHDGTFQMSSELNVSLIKQEDWRHYDCVAQLSGVENNIITTLDEKKILTNLGLGVAGVAVFPRDVMVPLIFLVTIFLVFCIFKKRIQDHLAACGSRLADLLCGVPSSRWCREDPGKDTAADILLSCHESQPDQQRPRHEPRAARLKSRLKSRPRHLHLSKKIKLLLNVITRSHSGILRMVKFHLLIMALNEAISSLQHLPLEKTSSDTTIA